ncbi:MAG: DnaB-like helicase N-terminal domain-containing protein [bacterium]|nr:DnaB-like helicase N-terminal domain-containing protein [bacterium]
MAVRKEKGLRVPPRANESEKALLGALMIRPEGMLEALDSLSPDAFYSEKHRIIYRAMLALYIKNEPVDIESVRFRRFNLRFYLATSTPVNISKFLIRIAWEFSCD